MDQNTSSTHQNLDQNRNPDLDQTLVPRGCDLDLCPENILIDVLSYLSVRELVRAGRVCRRWRRLVRDQRLWRHVDLTSWKGVTSRVLWLLLRQYLGSGLRCLRLRGLLLSARGGCFLSESWLRSLSSKCPRLTRLLLLHADLRPLPGCRALPPSLQELELRGCELPPHFFTQSLSDPTPASASAATQQRGRGVPPPSLPSGGVGIQRLLLNNVPSFSDQHLLSLASWPQLQWLQLRDTFRVTANGLRSCAARDGLGGAHDRLQEGPQGLRCLRFLEIGITGRQGYQLQMASLGLGAGWAGLEELSLGGKEVGPGLLCASRLRDLQRLCLWGCSLSEMQVVRSCRMLRGLRSLHFLDVLFQPRHCPSVGGGEGEGGGQDEQVDQGEEASDNGNEDKTLDSRDSKDPRDPVPSLRHSLAALLPSCSLIFTNCSVQSSSD